MTRCSRTPAQRFGAWLALFAMLAIYVGALVSQVRAAEPPLPHWVAELACDHDDGPPAPGAPAHHGPASALDACGYCSLLASSPGLGGSTLTLAWSFLSAVEPPRTLRLGRPGEPALFPGARPRAPPTTS